MSNKWPICLMMVLLGIAGCAEPVSPPRIVAPPTPTPVIAAVEHRIIIIARSVRRRPIISTVLGQGQDVTLILATIHGNEPAGTPLVRQLAEYLQQHPHLLAGRKAVLLPVANPDGMARHSRYNANGVDLNRNFATANRRNSPRHGSSGLSEPEARAIASLIRRYRPDRIVTIHQPLTCIDYDGPARALANHMARHCDLPIRKLGARPGSLGSYAGLGLRIPIVTLELPAGADRLRADTLWQRYGRALLAAVIYPQRAK